MTREEANTLTEALRTRFRHEGLVGELDHHGYFMVSSSRELRFTGRRRVRTIGDLEALVALPATLVPREVRMMRR